MMKYIKQLSLIAILFLGLNINHLYAKSFNMVFVPASEKGDENDFKGLIKNIEINV